MLRRILSLDLNFSFIEIYDNALSHEECDILISQFEKSLRVYWRYKWLIGSAGTYPWNIHFIDNYSANVGSNTLLQLESGTGNVAWGQALNGDATKYILDPLNFNYNTWYPLVETNGANNAHHFGLIHLPYSSSNSRFTR